MDGQSDRIDAYEGLASWWRRAEEIWEANRSSERLTLLERLNYQRILTQQFPIQSERIVYNASGMHLLAARLTDNRAVIEHALYWATAASTAEAHYLCAILNAPSFTELVRPFMSYGKDERHFDKHIWQAPVPLFDPSIDLHARLSLLGSQLEAAASALPIDPRRHFPAVRRDFRAFLSESDAGREADEIVEELLS